MRRRRGDSAPALRAGGFFAPIAVVVGLAVVLAGCADRSGEEARIEAALRSLNLEGRAAQLIASPIRLADEADYAAVAARRQATLPGAAPGMFWLTDARSDLVDSLRVSFTGNLPRPLLAADLPAPDAASPDWLGHLDYVVAPQGYLPASREGALFRRDVSVPLGLRAFGEATGDGEGPSTVWDAARVNAISLRPLRAALDEEQVGLIMPPAAPVALNPSDSLAGWGSADLVSGVLRRDLGWEGPIVADLRGLTPQLGISGAVAALRAGSDLILSDLPVELLASAIADAVRSQQLDEAVLDGALDRLLRIRLDLENVESRELPAIAHAGSANPPAPPLPVVDPDSVQMDGDGLAEVGEILTQGIEDSVFTAASVVVGRHGAVAYQVGIGTTPDSAEISPTTTRFDLASLSKVVGTTTAVGILLDRGEMELDAPVERYLPEFDGGDKGDVTIRHLLSHTSGLPAGVWLYGAADSEEGAYDRLFRVSLQREPGEAMEYSDLGMILLALAVERVTEMPLDEFLALNVFHPLGMRRTTYLPPASEHDDVVPTAMNSERSYPTRGVVHDGNAFRLNGVAGHAGLFSTAGDLAVFAQMMLNGGEYGGRRILSEEMVETLIEIQEGAGNRALGWDTPADRSSAGRYLSSRSFGHTGFTGTSIWIDPLRDIFVILLTNRTYPDADSGEMFDVRRAVHEAAVLAIDDIDISRRPGSR